MPPVADSSRYTFDPRLQRYRSPSGRLIPPRTVTRLWERIMADHRREWDGFADGLEANRLTPREFQTRIAQSLKRGHLQARALGVGGQEFMGPRHYGYVGGRLRSEYAYLGEFGQSIARGDLTMAEIRRRTDMYGQAAMRRTYDEGRRLSHEEAGFQRKRRLLGSGQPCRVCEDQAAMGWVDIRSGDVTGIGEETLCNGSDKCEISYGWSEDSLTPPRRAIVADRLTVA